MNTRVFAVAAIAAPTVLGVTTVLMLVAALAGRHPLWTAEQFNMSEAAAARDVATIAAMLERGDDPNVARPVRPPLLDSINRPVTPLEAGVLARRGEVVELLVSGGARVDATMRARLVCEALRHGDRDIAQLVGGESEDLECAP